MSDEKRDRDGIRGQRAREREARLGEQLRANLLKRKAQAKRRAGEDKAGAEGGRTETP